MVIPGIPCFGGTYAEYTAIGKRGSMSAIYSFLSGLGKNIHVYIHKYTRMCVYICAHLWVCMHRERQRKARDREGRRGNDKANVISLYYF